LRTQIALESLFFFTSQDNSFHAAPSTYKSHLAASPSGKPNISFVQAHPPKQHAPCDNLTRGKTVIFSHLLKHFYHALYRLLFDPIKVFDVTLSRSFIHRAADVVIIRNLPRSSIEHVPPILEALNIVVDPQERRNCLA